MNSSTIISHGADAMRFAIIGGILVILLILWRVFKAKSSSKPIYAEITGSHLREIFKRNKK